jgi:hypothetical protein
MACALGRGFAITGRKSLSPVASAANKNVYAAIIASGAIGAFARAKALARLKKLTRRPVVIAVPRRAPATVTAAGALLALARRAGVVR